MSIPQILRGAADLIEVTSLYQSGKSENEEPGYCALTSILEQRRFDPISDGAYSYPSPSKRDEAWAYLKDFLNKDDVGVYYWNDTAESTDVVTSALRAAADKYEEENRVSV